MLSAAPRIILLIFRICQLYIQCFTGLLLYSLKVSEYFSKVENSDAPYLYHEMNRLKNRFDYLGSIIDSGPLPKVNASISPKQFVSEVQTYECRQKVEGEES